MFLEFKFNLNKHFSTPVDRHEIFNYKNKTHFQKFFEITNTDKSFIECFSNQEKDINSQCNEWLSKLNLVIKQCFKKIRIKREKRNPVLKQPLCDKEELQRKINTEILDECEKDAYESDLEDLINAIQKVISTENKKIIEENIKSVEDPSGRFNQLKGWHLKKKLAPKTSREVPVGKKEEFGNLITDKEQLENVYINYYKKGWNQIK